MLDLPDFPQFKPLELKDRSLLQPFFVTLQPEISDRCFTNLFLWQDFYNICLSRYKKSILIFCASNKTPEKEFFFPPLGDGDMATCINACFNFMHSHNIKPIIRRASENFITKHITDTEKYEICEDLNISDYIYRAEDLINLCGRRYHGQRNFIKRFKKLHPDYVIEDIGKHNIPECIDFNDRWFENKLDMLVQKNNTRYSEKSEEAVYLKAEVATAKKILFHFKKLDLQGVAVRISGKIHAFTVGEKLNGHMALIHIEKCDHEYLGIGQFLSQRFCQQVWSDCEYINRMEDLGIENLRRAKLALGPHHMAKKYNIRPK